MTSPENMPLAKDLLHPFPEEEKRKLKKKCLVQSPNSYFMGVKCPGCYKITIVFSHAQTSIVCWPLHCPLSAYRRKSKAYRRMLLQMEEALKHPESRCMKNHPSKHVLDIYLKKIVTPEDWSPKPRIVPVTEYIFPKLPPSYIQNCYRT